MRVRNDQPGGRGAWPFDAPFHMILNLAMGGSWAAARGMDDVRAAAAHGGRLCPRLAGHRMG